MNMKVMIGLMGLLSAIAIGIVLHLTSGVFIPLLIAWFILQVFRPVIHLSRTLHLPPLINITLVFALLICISILGFHFGTLQLVEFSRAFSVYYPKLNEMYTSVLQFLRIPPDVLSGYNWLTLLRNSMRGISEIVYQFSSMLVLTLVFLMFMLVEAPFLNEKIDKAFLGPSATRIKKILSAISEQISSYLGTLALISAATGICVWFVLVIFGVELAAGWAVITFLLNFIPTIGSIIATIPPVLMAILQFSPSLFRPLIILLSLTVIQLSIGNVITPKVVGDRLGLSPIMILISLLLWSSIWGIPGALLSVPIASILKIVCENISSLRPLAVLMGSGESVSKIPVPVAPIHPLRHLHKDKQDSQAQEQAEPSVTKSTVDTVKPETVGPEGEKK